MLYLTCSMISSVDLACYGVSRAKDWVSVDCYNDQELTQLISTSCPEHQMEKKSNKEGIQKKTRQALE